jgi:molybdopterin-binding protein
VTGVARRSGPAEEAEVAALQQRVGELQVALKQAQVDRRRSSMELSARNQLRGTVTAIKLGGVMAEVTVEIGGQEIVSVITRSSVERLHLQVGDAVTAIIKSTEVMLGK